MVDEAGKELPIWGIELFRHVRGSGGAATAGTGEGMSKTGKWKGV